MFRPATVTDAAVVIVVVLIILVSYYAWLWLVHFMNWLFDPRRRR